ncbi:integrator complex assembly factor BRAT1 isoform X1 [Chelonoidis abingdonii]|uniref:BRCA1 associated ATM activator 1 n=1 Tax=Chelonoidis abingdonii TaxID=106734 RepID=A0A8C0HER7_CHEAB|nr:BRCA1-associated ATM activator 1 isoform X1 [Chelonoidis abingdonii]XP_032622031.1 BRCA1-associated ATM activator 1 isoform X1 [Chelonoidis abingdonii]
MDKECSQLLPSVCAVLADSRQLVADDTFLEKFLDWFKTLTETESSLLLLQENPCLTELITCVLKLKDPSSSTLSFILRLTGIFAASESCFQYLQQRELLISLFGEVGPLSSSLWEEASVRSGWVQGVHSMVQHQNALHFLCNCGAIDVIFTMQGDPSLFVASAANQLLVHMLTFSLQSFQTKPVNIKDCDWPICAQKLIVHIEESLNSNSASRIKQSLKLLTSVFGCCHDLWTEVLWSRLSEPIVYLLDEEPVHTGHLLVDLFLSMARSPVFSCPECSLWTSVTCALERLNPAQAGCLAVGVLKLQECPQAVRIQALNVLLQPMDCVLKAASQPLEYPGLLNRSVNESATVETLLSCRSSCASLLCQTLAHLEELQYLTCLPVDLPHIPLLQSVVTILQFCIGLATPASCLGKKISRILIGCFRVQRSALDILGALSHWESHSVFMGSVFDILLAYLKSPDTSPTVLKKSFQATLKWLVSLSEAPSSKDHWQQTDQFLRDLFLVLQKRLCSPYWEVRDSALEFLTLLIKHLREKEGFRQVLFSSEVPKLTEDLLQDPESYVRASAVTAMGQLSFLTHLISKKPGLENGNVKEKSIVAQLKEILSTDSEGFPRRAVIGVFSDWLREGHPDVLKDTEPFVSSVLQAVNSDFDWEVKAGGLELAEVFSAQTLGRLGLAACPYAAVLSSATRSTQMSESLQIFCRVRLFEFLFGALCDCDRPVAQKACDILIALKAELCDESSLKEGTSADLSTEARGIAWLEETLRKWSSCAKPCPRGDADEAGSQDPNGVLLVLRTVDLEGLHRSLNRSSDHIEKSPQSLLQDILATVGTLEENEADCY